MLGSQIAPILGIHHDTLYDRCHQEHGVIWSVYLQDRKSIGDANLHRSQYSVAVDDRNVTMLLHLGKHRLGQKDKEEKSEEKPIENEDVKKRLYEALDRIAELEKKLNESQSKTSQELSGSNPCDQPMDRISQ